MTEKKVEGYAGDMTPEESWSLLQSDENSVLIDVRSAAEWAYVGTADLSIIGKQTTTIEWQSFPNMTVNKNFIDRVREIYPNPETKILSICRSGQRSIATSRELTKAGYKKCYNVSEGFEGDKNKEGHRGLTGGWKFHGLPWRQS